MTEIIRLADKILQEKTGRFRKEFKFKRQLMDAMENYHFQRFAPIEFETELKFAKQSARIAELEAVLKEAITELKVIDVNGYTTRIIMAEKIQSLLNKKR